MGLTSHSRHGATSTIRLTGLLRSSPQVYGPQAVRRQTKDAEVDAWVLNISPAIKGHASAVRMENIIGKRHHRARQCEEHRHASA